MRAGAVTRSSRAGSSPDNVGHGGERRESERHGHGGERRESEPGDRTRDRRDSRWDEHRRVRREQLVEATLAAVSQHGAGVGMEQIAAAAGTSKTVVYRHFTDRAELYVAVCNRVAAQLLPKLQSAMGGGGSPRQMVAAVIDTYLAFIETDPELYRFVVDQQALGRPTTDPLTNLSELVGTQVAAAIAVALEQAGRDPAPAAPWGHGVVGMVRAAADWWLRAGRPMPRNDLAARLTDLAWAGFSGVVTTSEEDQ